LLGNWDFPVVAAFDVINLTERSSFAALNGLLRKSLMQNALAFMLCKCVVAHKWTAYECSSVFFWAKGEPIERHEVSRSLERHSIEKKVVEMENYYSALTIQHNAHFFIA